VRPKDVHIGQDVARTGDNHDSDVRVGVKSSGQLNDHMASGLPLTADKRLR
jgi:hypothetical protein